MRQTSGDQRGSLVAYCAFPISSLDFLLPRFGQHPSSNSILIYTSIFFEGFPLTAFRSPRKPLNASPRDSGSESGSLRSCMWEQSGCNPLEVRGIQPPVASTQKSMADNDA